MTTEERMLKLVQRLHLKTMTGEVSWQATSRAGVFQLAFPTHVVKLSVSRNEDDSLDYVVSISNESGTVIESASDVDLKDVPPDIRSFTVMKDLYERARRQALGVDEALDSLLGELG